MASMTIRLYPQLSSCLDRVSEQTGILRSSLILYALNDQLRLNKIIENDRLTAAPADQSIRIALRLPDALKKLLADVAAENQMSANHLVNYCIYMCDLSYWSRYSS